MPERPLLTFDMDGVLCRPPFGINPGTAKGKRRDARGKRGIAWFTERWRYHFRRPMPGAIEGFKALAQEFEVAVVTARGHAAEGMTRGWLKHHFGVEPRLYTRPSWHETSAQFKARMAGELRPLAHFEDDPFSAAWVAELVPRVFVVDWPRNKGLVGPNITRISRLEEALAVLREAGR
jgi:hypothetical protein